MQSTITRPTHTHPSTHKLPCRNPQKVTQTLDSISSTTGSSRLHGYTADLAALSEVRGLAKAVAAEHPELDVLINNAGVYQKRRE
jgi:short-subunit dehydrogenase involved in D-alanine esterification of teichoic acids